MRLAGLGLPSGPDRAPQAPGVATDQAGEHVARRPVALLRHREVAGESVEVVEQAVVAGVLQRLERVRAPTLLGSAQLVVDQDVHRTHHELRRLGRHEEPEPLAEHLGVAGTAQRRPSQRSSSTQGVGALPNSG